MSLWSPQVAVALCESADQVPVPVVHLLLQRGREMKLLLIRIQFLLRILYWQGKGVLIHDGLIVQTIFRSYLGKVKCVPLDSLYLLGCGWGFFGVLGFFPRAILRCCAIVISPLIFRVIQAQIAHS